MSNDPFMHGLGGSRDRTPPAVPLENGGEQDSASPAVVERADRLAEALSDPNRAKPGADQPEPVDYEVDSDYEVSSDTELCEIPDGAIGTVNNRPFSDFNAAEHKARQMNVETGDAFWVRALAPEQFVVVAQAVGATRARVRDEGDTQDEIDSSLYDKPLSQLKLSDFPPNHPVHRCGLNRYRRYAKKGFKFKPAYRSMWPLLLLVVVGFALYTFPIRALSLLPPDVIEQILRAGPPDKLRVGVQYLGLMLAVVAGLKALWQRHYRRYMLMPGFAKQEEGIIARKSTKIAYRNVVNYDVRQGPIARLLNYGTLELSSAGSDGAEIAMSNVLAPRLVEIVLEGKMAEEKTAR